MASSQDKIVEYHISRLQDKNPEVRLKSIRELDALGAAAAAAINALKACFESSEEEDVKLAARKAAYNIFVAARKSDDS